MKKSHMALVFGLATLAATATVAGLVFPVPVVARDSSPTDDILLWATNNLASIGSLTATVDCTSDVPQQSFKGGTVWIKGQDKLFLQQGNPQTIAFYDANNFNWYTPAKPQGFGVRWNDSSNYSLLTWARVCGWADPRSALMHAYQAPDGLTLSPNTYVVNATTCRLLSGTRFRLWVEAGREQRIIRYEMDDTTGNVLVMRGDFDDWTAVQGGEFPASHSLQVFDTSGKSYCWWSFTLTAMQAGGNFADSAFATVDPGDTSSGSGAN